MSLGDVGGASPGPVGDDCRWGRMARLTIELVGRFEVKRFERAEGGGDGSGAQAPLEAGTDNDAALLAAECCL